MTPDELVARESIRDVIARYNHAGDRGRLAELAQCFTEDGVLELEGEPPLRGRAAIEAYLAGVAKRVAASARGGQMRHHVSSLVIELEGAGRAHAWSYFCVFTEIGVDHWGRYADELVRSGDAWLFAHRRVRVDGSAPGSRVVVPA
jgi:uncharacterized protein (TIGR02246 family)